MCNISSVQTQVYTLSRLMRSLCVVVLPTARIALMPMSVPVLLSSLSHLTHSVCSDSKATNRVQIVPPLVASTPRIALRRPRTIGSPARPIPTRGVAKLDPPVAFEARLLG